jgi:hypothetical protein
MNVRIYPRWTFDEVRRAALALSRAVERRAPFLATSKWWKEERHGVFLDYNQNVRTARPARHILCGRSPTLASLRLFTGTRFLRDTGRRDEARAMLADIYNWFTEDFDTAGLKDAKALLDELRA